MKESPLHDGAVIIRNNRLQQQDAFITVRKSQSKQIARYSSSSSNCYVENNNMFVIVVSEETGRISVALSSNLNSGLSIQRLRKEMESSFSVTKFKEEVAFSAPKTEMNLK